MTQGKDVHAKMRFVKPDSNDNRRYITPGLEINTGFYEEREVLIRDARPIKDKVTLDSYGFQLFDHHTNFTDFTNLEKVSSIYGKEIEDFLLRVTGCDKVITYRPYIRHSQSSQGAKTQPPATDVHVDLTPRAGKKQAAGFMSSHDPDFKYSRYLHLSCWRTFSEPPQDWPLGMCNSASIPDDDGLVNSAIWQADVPDLENMPPLPEDVKSEAFVFPWREGMEWWYFSHMTGEELLCLKLNDSETGKGKRWRTPHCSFLNDEEGTHPRESIEIRACCYWI